MTQRREWALGAGQARFEEPDLLLVHFQGETSLEDARRAIDVYREVGTARPFFALINVEKARLSPEGWDCLSRESRAEWFQGVIFVRAGAIQKAVAKAMALALNASGGWMNGFHFADSEAEARALADTLRARPRASSAG